MNVDRQNVRDYNFFFISYQFWMYGNKYVANKKKLMVKWLRKFFVWMASYFLWEIL